MVTGQAFVLYSRLNLVVQNKILLRGVLAAIIIDGIALHTPILIFIYGANKPSSRVENRWVRKFNTMERIQLVGFSIQETVLSGLYIVATVKLLTAVYYERTRRAMVQLLAVNFLCIGMDAILVGLEFSDNYFGEASVKPLIYAVKLKLEFAVYSQLVGFTKATFAKEEDLCSQNGKFINTPADFFKTLPNILAPPPVCSTPTIHTHPEHVTQADKNDMERPKLAREWDSLQLELADYSIAAALITSGGRGGESARNLRGSPPADKGQEVVRPSVNLDADGRSQTGEVPKEWSGIYMA